MQKRKNLRLIVLSVLAVLSGLLYFAVANPWSPIANVCEDLEYANEQYAHKNIKKRNKFIVLRNKHCKVLLSERKNAKVKGEQLCSLMELTILQYMMIMKEK